ncbi:hypothetical protein [Sulfurimonas sp. HSL3-7]|uniref:hypothetical protein n=1 Tax=Sulfonitrofixus jiaomeiensis TaxID=3131938 RepID=UPI0031F965A9
MKRLLLLFSLLFTVLFAPTALQAKQKVIYLSYSDDLPERVFNGEFFPVTIKTLSTIGQHHMLKYSFTGGRGARLQNKVPDREDKGTYVLDTFYFLATSSTIVLPDITASIDSERSSLGGESIEGVSLNPDNKFANILADSFHITAVDAKKYDNKHNILTFDAEAEHCNIKAFKLHGVEDQGFESVNDGIKKAKMTYYAVLPKKYEKLEFTYFDLEKERYMKVRIPIEVIDDSVSTQSDLKPTENKNYIIKMAVAAVIIVIALVLLIVYRKWWITLFIIIPGIYIALQAAPAENICVNADTPVYLLPIENATVFDIVSSQGSFEVKHSVKGYKQITYNKKIGWISEDDICSH